VGYAYDAAGRLASMTYPGGNVAAQTYTPRGQIAGIDLDGGTLASCLRGRALILDMIPITDSLFAVAFEQI
jgi:YD repeat-containing protein